MINNPPIKTATVFGSGTADVPGKAPDADVSVTPAGATSDAVSVW
jgi:hypothetical protein